MRLSAARSRAFSGLLNRHMTRCLSGINETDPDRLARFDVEAKAVAAINHPNIITPAQSLALWASRVGERRG